MEKICPECNSKFKSRNKYCSVECREKNKTHSEEVKRKLSNARKKFLKENPDKHHWKRKDKFKSVPCEKLKGFLKESGINFVEEWQPLVNRFYSIDIAFPDKKIGIEVNGNQHYNRDGTLKEYYQKRHDEICNEGWTLYEIHYSQCHTPSIVLNNLKLGVQPDYTEYFKILEEKRKHAELNAPMQRGEKMKINNNKKYEKTIEDLKNSNIDFSNFGWVSKAAVVIGIKPQKVSNWMKRHMKDFYESNCFKRKA